MSLSLPPLVLPAAVASEIVARAAAETPREACGVLVGEEAGERTRVVRQVAARNLHPRPRERFSLAPEDFLAAEKRARAEGLTVVGFWHSHPASAPLPSARDRAAAWEQASYLIVSLAADRPELRCWRLVAGRLVEQEIVTRAAVEGEAST